MTARFSELLPRAVTELEERWRSRKYSALEVREYCSKLMGRMRSADEAFQPRLDALLEEASRDPALITFDIDELVENHDEGENYRDTFEGAYNMLDRAATVPKQHARLVKFVTAVLVEARAYAAKDPSIAEYLGDWLAIETWSKEGIEVPGAKPATSKSPKKSPAKKSSAKKSTKSAPKRGRK